MKTKIAICKNCNKPFEYKWSGRNNSCSKECTVAIVSNSKLKYTQTQIDFVVSLKKQGKTNNEIVLLSGVKLSKVKEIVKDNNVLLSPEERQRHAYEAKINKDPLCMEKMRKVYHKIVESDNSLEKMKAILIERGFEYVSGFKSKTKSFVIKCLKCNNTREAHRLYSVVKNSCMHCSGCNRTSEPEIEIKEWVESLGLKVEKYKFKKRAGGIEIDVYIPELKIGIEYCGLYWHNECSPTPRGETYHYNKMIKAHIDGIRLITIFGDEWLNRKEQIKGFLLSTFNKNLIQIYARKTEVKEVPKNEAKDFLEKYHIQGSARIKISFGLFYENELIGLITGNDHHRQQGDGALVLNRLVFKNNVSIIGGASKLLKYLTDYAIKNNYLKIISWSDNRWSIGRVYEKTGFTLEEELKPDYSYVNRTLRISKQSCQKKHLLKKGATGETEHEMAISLEYYRIWDCGKKRWILNLT